MSKSYFVELEVKNIDSMVQYSLPLLHFLASKDAARTRRG